MCACLCACTCKAAVVQLRSIEPYTQMPSSTYKEIIKIAPGFLDPPPCCLDLALEGDSAWRTRFPPPICPCFSTPGCSAMSFDRTSSRGLHVGHTECQALKIPVHFSFWAGPGRDLALFVDFSHVIFCVRFCGIGPETIPWRGKNMLSRK